MLVVVLLLVCVAAVAGCGYRLVAARALEREVAERSRDAETGIILGAEPVSLGSGPHGVLLIHGFPGTPTDLGHFPQKLAREGYRVSCPLLPGHGRRPQDLLDENADTLLAAVEKAYGDLREQCSWVGVVGISMGGTLAVRLATESALPPPDALILVCPYFAATYRWYAVLPLETWQRILTPVIPYVIKGNTFAQIRRREALPHIISYSTVPSRAIGYVLGMGAEIRKDPPDSLPCRTLVVSSKHDGSCSPGQIRKMADHWNVPPSDRLVLMNSNHIIFWDYDREIAESRMLEFLGEERYGAGP